MGRHSRAGSRVHKSTTSVTVLLAALVTASCSSGDREVPPPKDESSGEAMTKLLHLDFDGAKVTGDRVSVKNSGELPVQVRVTTGGGGKAVIAAGQDGRDALRLPPMSDSPTPQGAVLLVTPDAAAGGDADRLSPESNDFTYGGTFALDQQSEQQGGSDNGNNFLQRGLAADPTQYKLQVDHGHVSCRVKGDLGELEVISHTAVEPKTWYTATCSREGRKLTLTLQQAGGSTERVSRTGDTGSVTAPSTTPLTIGGKTFDNHVVSQNSDQFNGQVGEVFLDVRSPGQ
jgi:hypothetical protein